MVVLGRVDDRGTFFGVWIFAPHHVLLVRHWHPLLPHYTFCALLIGIDYGRGHVSLHRPPLFLASIVRLFAPKFSRPAHAHTYAVTLPPKARKVPTSPSRKNLLQHARPQALIDHRRPSALSASRAIAPTDRLWHAHVSITFSFRFHTSHNPWTNSDSLISYPPPLLFRHRRPFLIVSFLVAYFPIPVTTPLAPLYVVHPQVVLATTPLTAQKSADGLANADEAGNMRGI